jgi:hypothetical protein
MVKKDIVIEELRRIAIKNNNILQAEDVVNYAKDRKDWIGHIKRLTESEELRNEQGVKLHEYCRKHYNFNEINEKRKNAFLSILS